jgi:hypothetical protein
VLLRLVELPLQVARLLGLEGPQRRLAVLLELLMRARLVVLLLLESLDLAPLRRDAVLLGLAAVLSRREPRRV